jgi:hypothetical protein
MRRESAHQHVKFDFESSILSAGRMAQPGLRRLQESPAPFALVGCERQPSIFVHDALDLLRILRACERKREQDAGFARLQILLQRAGNTRLISTGRTLMSGSNDRELLTGTTRAHP